MLQRIACIAFLAFAFLRGVLVLTHAPMIGVANNYDMIRVQGCIDAYPDRPADIEPWSNSWEAPIKNYRFRDDVHPGCYFSSEALFAFALLPALHVIALHNVDGTFPLTAIGWLKFLCLISACCAVSIALLRRGKDSYALANSLLAASVLFDPAVTIYFNTFYAEFSAVLFAYLAVASAFIVLLEKKPGYLWLIVCAVATALMCVSKLQHVAFGLFMLAMLFVALRLSKTAVSRPVLIVIGIGAIVGGSAQWLHMRAPQTVSMNHANLTNTVLQAILGRSRAPATTAERLGLPVRCAQYAGQNWFSPGFDVKHPCPEVFEVSRIRFLYLAITEPKTIERILFGGIQRARPWIPDYLGKVEGGKLAPLPPDFFSWSAVLDRLSQGWFRWLFVLPPLIASAIVWRQRRRQPASAPAFVLVLCACYPWFALLTVVFGDGYADTAKQFHLGMTALLAFWLMLAMMLANSLADRLTRTRGAGQTALVSGNIAV